MLSIGKIAQGQHRYYERQVAQGADDYYAGRGESPGNWVGKGAEALNLKGRVRPSQFNALLAGNDPTAPATRLRSATQDPKVAALDLTFSAPKSISVLFAIAPEDVSGALVACHEQAVQAALEYLEDTAVTVRRGHAGQHVEPAEGLIAAAYRHRMSRALDPQLHTHVVAANLARGPDGRFTALHGTPLYRAAKTAGFLYQAHLRALVSERLGLEWGEVVNGAAELAGVERPVLEHFSKRRHEMLREALAGGIGLGTKAAAESAALATRDRKQYGVETHTWREEVRARSGELGLGAEEVADLLRKARERVSANPSRPDPQDERALADRLAGPEGLTERSNAFDERDVLRALAGAASQGAHASDLRARAKRFAEREDVIALDAGEMTTTELIACERRLIAAAVGRAGEGGPILDAPTIDRAIATADRPLTAEQEAAVRATAGAAHGVSVIEALAGTGKTYTAGVLRQAYEAAGHVVLGVAPTGRAVRELVEQAGVAARTLDRLLIDLDQLGDELPKGCVLIFDEAGMAATRPTARLLEAAQRAEAKVIAIGDPGQLASVQAGGWLAAVGRELGVVRLTEVMRQRDPAERRALAALHDGRPHLYLDWAQQAGRIVTFEDPVSACGAALREWARAAATVGPAHAVMIARENETRAKLNQMARELRSGLGALGEERSYGALDLAAGDRVICRRNDRTIDVDNGMRGTVCALDSDHVVIDTDGGLVRELPAAYVAEHVEHAYALTGHGMQGATVQAAIVLASPHDLTAGWSYTALSRARGDTRLLVHDDDFSDRRDEIAPPDRSPAPTRGELLDRVRRHMLERDDEDLAVERLHTRPAALPARAMQRVEDLKARALTLATQREHLIERLAELPEPRRRLVRNHRVPFGYDRSPERNHLTTALAAVERDLNATLTERVCVERAPPDPGELCAERAEQRVQRERRPERELDLGIGL
jgi:conjugative relaxase-like TrwC/TraI family protein